MPNMSCCRFENTFNDLIDCLEALEYRDICGSSEKEYAERLLKNVLDFCTYEGIIDGYNSKKIKFIINECEE